MGIQLLISFIFVIAIAFGAMAFFLRKYLNKNLISATSHLEDLSSEYAKREEEISKQLAEAEYRSKAIQVDAQKDAQKHKEEVLAKAQEEKDKMLHEAHQKCDEMIKQADKARQALIAEIDKKRDERAAQRAIELIQAALPEAIRRDIHQRWVDELMASDLQQLERLRISTEISEAKITGAFKLTPEQHQALKEKIQKKLERSIELKEELDAGTIAGLVVSIGSLVLDGSLRFKILEATRRQEASG